MAVQIDATTPRSIGGITGREIVEGFVTVRTAGAREFAEKLEQIAQSVNARSGPLLQLAAERASKPLREAYASLVGDVTGNLKKSIVTRGGRKKYPGVGIAVTGPLVTGPVGASKELGSGNHAWLVEFGTGSRKPGTQGRRTYINVHQMINGKMTRSSGPTFGAYTNQQFENMSRGYYFLMGSKNERTRQARAGSGYPHDFMVVSDGEMHPMTMHPGETYGAMYSKTPARHPMQTAIRDTSGQVLATLIEALKTEIGRLLT